jgi:HD-GYP domain-containing protein (c-di-GMP phosphodiesterase class II)
MSSDPPNASPSPAADSSPADPGLAELVRLRGAPLLEGLEAHRPGSREHAEATGSYAFAAAVGIGLDRAAAELSRETAKLHDVGMVYVPVAILRRPPEELDPAERTLIDSHLEAAYRLTLGAGIPEDVCGWILRTRERWSGGGPEGLAGEAIPLESRMIRVACAADLMLASLGSEQTIASLRAAAGSELDPPVVEVLTGVLARVAPSG